MNVPPSNDPPTPSTDQPVPELWRVGDWWVDSMGSTLSRAGHEPRRLEPLVMALLVFLIEQSPKVVGRDEIFEKVWHGRAVVDGALSRAMSLLRQALGDDRREPRYIETVPRKGYRLVAAVERIDESAAFADPQVRQDLGPQGLGPQDRDPPEISRDPQQIHWVFPALALLMLVFAALWWSRSSNRSEAPPPNTNGLIRLAVLPLDSFGGEAEDPYLADGLTEELIHQLSALSALGVVSRTSVTAAKAEGLTAPEIARRLGVDYLLEGSVLAAGERLRITVQLIAPERDEHLWSRTYDRTMADVLALHREVAVDVTTQVKAELTLPEQSRLASREPVDGEAYRLYLQGRQRLDRRTRKDLSLAQELVQRSVELDPNLAASWAALGKIHLLSELYLDVPQVQAYARSQEAVDIALSLDPGSADAHVSMGLLRLLRDWDWSGAERSYRTAIRLSPSYTLAHQWLSECLSLSGRHGQALDSIRRAADLDPLSPLVHAAWGQRLNAAGRHQQALERFKAADSLGAEFSWHLKEAAYAHQRLGDVPAALEAYVERMRRRDVEGPSMESLRRAIESEGLRGYWRWQHQRLAKIPGTQPALLAEALAGSGSYEEAWPWLQAAVAKRGIWFLHLAKSPALDPLRQDPRFQALVEQSKP